LIEASDQLKCWKHQDSAKARPTDFGEHGGKGFGPMRQNANVLYKPPDWAVFLFGFLMPKGAWAWNSRSTSTNRFTFLRIFTSNWTHATITGSRHPSLPWLDLFSAWTTAFPQSLISK
jgi:hypothetical protein